MAITDAPLTDLARVQKAEITVSEVRIRAAKGVATVNSNRWVTIYDAAAPGAVAKVYDMLQLRGGVTADLTAAVLPAGDYERVRIVVSAGELIVDNVTYSTANGLLNIAPVSSAGLKIKGNDITVAAGGVADILLDLDLTKSFNSTGPANAPTGYVLLPVIRPVNMASAGSLAGVVLSDNLTPADPADDVPQANVNVTATLADGSTAASVTDAQGAYVILGLQAGKADVLFQYVGHDDLTLSTQIKGKRGATLDATLVKQ